MASPSRWTPPPLHLPPRWPARAAPPSDCSPRRRHRKPPRVPHTRKHKRRRIPWHRSSPAEPQTPAGRHPHRGTRLLARPLHPHRRHDPSCLNWPPLSPAPHPGTPFANPRSRNREPRPIRSRPDNTPHHRIPCSRIGPTGCDRCQSPPRPRLVGRLESPRGFPVGHAPQHLRHPPKPPPSGRPYDPLLLHAPPTSHPHRCPPRPRRPLRNPIADRSAVFPCRCRTTRLPPTHPRQHGGVDRESFS